MNNKSYYFQHDFNAANDEKILYLRSIYGMEGYGLYWYFIELMHQIQDSKLKCKLINGISYQLNIDIDKLLQFYNSCIDTELFVTDGEFYWSQRVLENKEIDETLFVKGKNEFIFNVPSISDVITFKLLTHGDEQKIDRELESLKKINQSPEMSTRLKYTILSVNGMSDPKSIREYVDTYLLARDARVLREYIRNMQPDINLTATIETSNGLVEGVNVPIGLNFFWPDFGV